MRDSEMPVALIAALHNCDKAKAAYAQSYKQKLPKALLHVIQNLVPKEEWELTKFSIVSTSLEGPNDPIFQEEATKLRTYLRKNGLHTKKNEQLTVFNFDFQLALTWVSLNYALGEGIKIKEVAEAALLAEDGGALIYIPNNFQEIPPKYIKRIYPLGRSRRFYSHRLGCGLDDIRKKILQAKQQNTAYLKSFCMCRTRRATWYYNSINYTIKGRSKTNVNYEECKNDVLRVVSKLSKPPGFTAGKYFFALQKFFSVAERGSLVCKKRGGTVTLEAIEKRAKEICEENHEDIFLCMDMVFMHTLFKESYGLKDKTEVKFYEKVCGFPIHWSLAAAMVDVRNFEPLQTTISLTDTLRL
ncbi:hypothetical protein RUM44_010571 [Polyplax serrata]|uniref:Uncharacterized protein n=1 Tax=Polyplax serrata TaxID=468196 RepID=A0ABR1AVW2_POLSC